MAYVILIVSFSLFCLSHKEPGAEYNEWQKYFHASLILNIFLQLTFDLPSPPFQCHLVFTKRWPVSWNIIWGKGGLSSNFWKINSMISFGFVEWTVVDHLLTEAGQCLDHFFYSLLWSLNTPLFCVKAQHLKKLQINLFLLTPLPLLP